LAREEVYISTDVETDGPIPGIFSLRSIGMAAYDKNGDMLDTFQANLLPLPGAQEYEPTIRFYQDEAPAAWAALLENAEEPADVMRRCWRWLKDMPGLPVFVGYPVGFDFSWVRWYLHRFNGYDPEGCPFSHSALDIKTAAMLALRCGYRSAVKRSMPKTWFDPNLPHTHVALDDAIEQGYLWFSIKRYLDNIFEEADLYKLLHKEDVTPFHGYDLSERNSK
jgi:hypothetical protein